MDTVSKNINQPLGKPSFAEAFKVWFQIGVLSFGGPAAQIALMHKMVVDDHKWLSERQYLNALSFCMLLPGPEAMQLATYAGWRLHGWRGGLAAGLLFVLPGAFIVLALAMLYAAAGNLPIVETIFIGIKATVLVIVIQALKRVAAKALIDAEHWVVALTAFVAIFVLALPYPLIVLLAGLYGFMHFASTDGQTDEVATRPQIKETIMTGLFWLVIWLAPLLALTSVMGDGQILSDIGWFFSKLAVVTFGGAYAVLAYMGQDVVMAHGWLTAGQMMDGLGLAETTPGPLILVTKFVGFLAAYQHEGSNNWLIGVAGAVVALWVTFAPCFMWIFAGAPYIEWLNHQPRLKGALTGITAAVVGVILNLSIWFALHVFFAEVTLKNLTWGQLWIPDFGSLNWQVLFLTLICSVLLLKFHWRIPSLLAVAAGLAVGMQYLIV